ncbi:MAG: hypothetical protein ACFFCM_11695 [Promethearchaeota archaeon]
MDKKREFDITEFWVINKGGLPLFCFSPRKDLDPALVGGFFSAIQNFVKELESDSQSEGDYIQSISFGDNYYIFRFNNKFNLFFISKSPKKIKIKKINSHLQNLESMFIEQYHNKIADFDGNVTNFDKFLVIIDKYFQDNFAKLKGMW